MRVCICVWVSMCEIAWVSVCLRVRVAVCVGACMGMNEYCVHEARRIDDRVRQICRCMYALCVGVRVCVCACVIYMCMPICVSASPMCMRKFHITIESRTLPLPSSLSLPHALLFLTRSSLSCSCCSTNVFCTSLTDTFFPPCWSK